MTSTVHSKQPTKELDGASRAGSREEDAASVDVLHDAAQTEREVRSPQVGKIVRVDDAGGVLVQCLAYPQVRVYARVTSTAKARLRELNWKAPQEVLLVFEDGQLAKPIVIDTLVKSADLDRSARSVEGVVGHPQEAFVDGERIKLSAEKEIVLRCGSASIVMTREGRVIIRGAHVVSRSTGVNKIKGGSVQIN